MARKNKKNIRNLFIEKISETKWLVIAIASVILAGGFVFGVRSMFLNNGFFDVEEVQINGDTGHYLRGVEKKLRKRYVGRNIFTVSLSGVSTYAINAFPQIKKLEARKSMPDMLEIDVTPRVPVAFLDTGRGYVLDDEGMVLATGAARGDVVKIIGISFFLNSPSVGKRVKNTALKRALTLLDGVSEITHGNKISVDYIDVSDKKNLLLGIDGVVIKMGKDDFPRKVDELKEILEDSNMSLKEINYIDLRFEDAVISPR